VLIGLVVLELLARHVARRSLLEQLVGWHPSEWTLAAVAAFTGALAATRMRARTGLVFCTLFAIGLAAQVSLGARLQSDGFYYFAYVRSFAFDGDLNFSNDYTLLGLGDRVHLFTPTPTGHAQSAATVGPALLWAPFFGAGHAVALYLSASDKNVNPDGTAYPYRQAVCVAGLFYGLIGCWFMYRLCTRFFEKGLTIAAVAGIVAGSFIFWYFIQEPTMTHAPSMALVAGFAWAWAATQERRTRVQWILLGGLAGLMTLVRWQNALFAILPACDSARILLEAWRRSDRHAGRAALVNGILFTGVAALAFVPQLLAWRAIYGSWFAVSPLGPQIRLDDPRIVDILWSSRNGLFSTSPVLFVGAIGLVAIAWLRPAIGAPAVLAVASMTYFNASIQDWWGSAAFGGRRFDGTLPLFCLGLAQAFTAILEFVRRRPAIAIWATAAFLITWNLTLMNATRRGVVRLGEPASFGDVMAAQARSFHGWFGNPFTYPASLFYALRNGVWPSRYDLLSVNRFLTEPARPYGRIDIGGDDEWVLGEGWHQREQEADVSFRWAMERAEILVPLDHPEALRVQVRLHSFGHSGAPEQTLTVFVNGHAHGPVAVPHTWHTNELVVSRDVWRAGVNRLALRFAWARRPSDVGMGNDGRPLAAAVDYVRIFVAER
jgi:hypothetical protein